MITSRQEQIISLMRSQLRPAVGCTEPAAAAYAAAVSARTLGVEPERITVAVSRNILKNAMGVGIPGTDMVGLPIAVALGALYGDADASLAVLHRVRPEDVLRANTMIAEGRVEIRLSETEQKLYIDVLTEGEGHTARAVIEQAHTHITRIERDGRCVQWENCEGDTVQDGAVDDLSLREIDNFVRNVSTDALNFLQDCVEMNTAIAQEGLKRAYGMAIGKSLYDNMEPQESEERYAMALTCAAADARMGGCILPVMSSCGSGNQGLTATLPIIAVGQVRGLSREALFRALSYSLLVTIYVKRHLGKLSALCACSVGASIGTACALTYLDGGDYTHVCHCVDNVVADVSGVICDGAKAGCSLKIATGVSSAFRCAMLAMKNHNATRLDGIVGANAEASVDNLANLCNTGMSATDQVILDMLVCK